MLVPHHTDQSLWIGRNAPGTLVIVELSEPGSRIQLNHDQAATLAEMLLHQARLARQQVFQQEMAQLN